MVLIWKKGYFLPTFYIFLVTREDTQTFHQHMSHLHTNTYFVTLLTFLPYQLCKKKYEFLFGVMPGVDSFSRHFGAINK